MKNKLRDLVQKQLIMKILYYFAISILYTIKETGSPYIILMFIIAFFIMMYSMTFFNYKIYPTKNLGKILYWFTVLIKVIFYIITIGVSDLVNSESYLKVLLIFLFLELFISYVYVKYANFLLYNFNQDDIDSYFIEKAVLMMNKKSILSDKSKYSIIIGLILFHVYGFSQNYDIIYLITGLIFDAILTWILFRKNENWNGNT